MNCAILPLLLWMAVATPGESSTLIEESFKVTTHNVEVKKFTDSSIQLKSEKDTYVIKLEPNKQGNVAFSVSGIGYLATYSFKDLQFGIRITGYQADKEVYPAFSLDGNNEEVRIEQNTMAFRRIYGSIPVWFHEQVDSIKLEYENSLMANVQQYLRIEDLRIVSSPEVSGNPALSDCVKQHIMVAIDGSSSILPLERRRIAKQFLKIVRHSEMTRDSNTFTILEFGSDVLSEDQVETKKELVKTLKKYKKKKRWRNREITWTNWSSAFEAAIDARPDLFIFLTDGWSNWYDDQPASFTAQFEHLMRQTNKIKENGTRMLFVATKMDLGHASQSVLSQCLNGDQTKVVNIDETVQRADVGQADLVKISAFTDLERMNFATILQCPQIAGKIADEETGEWDRTDMTEE